MLEAAIEKADERKRRKKEKEVARKSATKRLRLPGKLADCSSSDSEITELFLVEGEFCRRVSKTGSVTAKHSAVLPLRGKS